MDLSWVEAVHLVLPQHARGATHFTQYKPLCTSGSFSTYMCASYLQPHNLVITAL